MRQKPVSDIADVFGKILTPKMLLEEGVVPGVSKTWLYDNWEDLGGVTIGNKKFILLEKLYACIYGTEQKMACEDKRAGQRVEKVSASVISGNGGDQLGNQKRSKISGTTTPATGGADVLTVDHGDDFGFGQFV